MVAEITRGRGARDAYDGGQASLSLHFTSTGASSIQASMNRPFPSRFLLGLLPALSFALVGASCGTSSGKGGSSSGGSGGSGGSGVCAPMSKVACYSGPEGTQDVGVCKAGTSTCNAEGTAYGPCEGEITPKAEDCSTPADESCTGVSACPGDGLWSQRFGSNDNDFIFGSAVDSAGTIVLTGPLSGAIDFGDGMLTSAGSSDVFIARLGAAGDHLTSQRFGDADEQSGFGVAAFGPGEVVVTGNFSGTLDFSSEPLVSAGGSDVFLARFDFDSSKELAYSRSFGDAKMQSVNGITGFPSGDVAIVGPFSGTVPFGGEPLVSVGGTNTFVAKFDAAGSHLFSRGFGGDTGTINATALGAAADGGVIVTGFFTGALSWGSQTLVSKGDEDILLAKLDAKGEPVWSRSFGDVTTQNANSIAVLDSGEIVITGRFKGQVDFGGGPLVSAGGYDIFVAKFDASGAHLFSRSFGDADWQTSESVSVDSSGNIVITGYFYSEVDFGGGPLVSAGGSDVFAAKFDAAGNPVWSRSFGDDKDEFGIAVSARGPGDVVLVGVFTGSIDFGNGPLESEGGTDIFVAKLAK